MGTRLARHRLLRTTRERTSPALPPKSTFLCRLPVALSRSATSTSSTLRAFFGTRRVCVTEELAAGSSELPPCSTALDAAAAARAGVATVAASGAQSPGQSGQVGPQGRPFFLHFSHLAAGGRPRLRAGCTGSSSLCSVDAPAGREGSEGVGGHTNVI